MVICYISYGYYITAGGNSLSLLFPVAPCITDADKGFSRRFGCVPRAFVIDLNK